jgi:drug/metabolite transporter (DMT)-like permease
LGSTEDRLIGALAVAAAASMWGTLGIFAKLLYAQGVSFEALVAVRASVGWLAVIGFLLATRGVRLSGSLAGISPFSCRWGSSGSGL